MPPLRDCPISTGRFLPAVSDGRNDVSEFEVSAKRPVEDALGRETPSLGTLPSIHPSQVTRPGALVA
jgi:hypothetical protein